MSLAAVEALFAQTVPLEAIDQLRDTVGARVEAVTILGGDYGAAGGVYTFRGGNLADLSVAKLGGAGEITAPRPLGPGEVKWAPVLQGNIGHIDSRNEFRRGYLQGNVISYDVLAAQLGGGARFYFDDRFSLAPTISGMFGHTESDFVAHNANGQIVEQYSRGKLVNWKLDSWSVSPGIDGRYEWVWGRTRWELSSRYTFFHTESFQSTSTFVRVDGDSHMWENKLDVDVPLGWKLFGRELHTGGFFARTELFGGVADGLREDHTYTANGRLVLDFTEKLKFVRWLGLGATYFFGDRVSGWSAGVDVRFDF